MEKNIISILEKLGSDASLRIQSENQSGNAALFQLLDFALIQSLEISDISAAERYLGTRSRLVCGIQPAEEPDNVPPAERPDKDDDEKESIQLLRRA